MPHGHLRGPTVTTRHSVFSVQMERPAHVLAFEYPPEPTDLIHGLEERVIAKDVRVLSFNDIFDLADGCGRGVADSLDVLRNEQEVVGIDMAVFDEPPGLLWAAAGVVPVHETALAVHEAVQVAAGAGQALAEVVGSHLQHLAADGVAGTEDLAEREDQPLLAVQAEEHPHRAA